MKNTLLALFAFSALALNAQPTLPPIFCGNELFSHIVSEKYPELDAAFKATFEEARAPQASARSPLTVNVVVHVVWNQPEENLADSIILDQIAVLNADYNRQNADSANLRDIFKPVAGNAQIHFNLVEIVRVQTSSLFEVSLFGSNLLPEVKHDDDGGSDAWDTEKYLNIWVCKIQPINFGGIPIGQILGFAFPPNNIANWPPNSGSPNADEDGVVIDYRVFGSNNPNTLQIPGSTDNLVVRGRTPVHEVGHYLGLRHIWGDGGIFGPNDCDQSDGVDDTPYANVQSAFDCDTTKNTCEQVEMFYNEDVSDLVENFMDYSSETCQNMFTKGQVEIMRNVLQGPRSGLLVDVAAPEAASQKLNFTLSPNPANERIILKFNLSEKHNVSLRLLNANGQTIRSEVSEPYPVGAHQLEMDIKNLAPGLYFLEMQTEQGVSTKKLVVK